MANSIVVDNKRHDIIKRFQMYYSGWECDEYGYVVKDGDFNRLVLTNHGRAYFADVSILNEFIKEWSDAITDAQDAKDILGLRSE